MRNTFGPQRKAATGESRKMHIEELMRCTFHEILFSDQIKKVGMGGT
jgi:hypothetical protein